jgi:anti-sigma factor RsiW
MTDHETWITKLSLYLDGELEADTRAAVDRHLAECAACRAALDDLRAIVAAAPGYQGAPPARDLWPAIASGIARRKEVRFPTRRDRGSRRFTWGQLAAASVAAAALGLGAAWVALGGGAASTSPGAGASAPAPVTTRPVKLRPDQAYDQAVADLERVLAEGRGRLDSATVRVIEENLQIIDRAIAEAEAAIAADPGNAYLESWIAANMRRKLDLLRRAASAIALQSS